MRFWSQVREVARRDLLAEQRAGEVVSIVIPFGAVALMAFPLALGIDSAVISRVGPAVFWVVTLLFTMQIALRNSASDRPAHRAVLALLGVDPLARLLGRSLASAVLIGIFMAVLFPLMVLFYTPDLPRGWPAALIPAALSGIGLAEVATLAAELTAGLRTRSTLAPLIVAPLAIPLLIGASQAMESLAVGGSILPWVVLVTATDLALAVISALIARPLEEASL
ncbi:MAG TPA: heme exporter protein CcmB [Acidimicrobiia bacterium]|nr:heme exporter protein CcmB [Acidimicrobiia bacterium]